jgi:hypothetical protein
MDIVLFMKYAWPTLGKTVPNNRSRGLAIESIAKDGLPGKQVRSMS